MVEKPLTEEYLDKSLDKLAGMIKGGFDENTEQHRQIFARFEKIDERFVHLEARLDRVEGDLTEIKENMVGRDEQEDLKARMEFVEKKVGIIS